MKLSRSAGIFLHPTSLPSPFGIGDLGEDAIKFIDMVAAAGHRYWQICPLGPAGKGNSPYQSPCSFAGNTMLISPLRLYRAGLLTDEELTSAHQTQTIKVNFPAASAVKENLFIKAYARFANSDTFDAFCFSEASWLNDYALFMAIKEQCNNVPWYEWDMPLRRRDGIAVQTIAGKHADRIRYYKFLQFQFYTQWGEIRRYAESKGISIIGDIPVYTAYDSVDVWAAPHLFELDESFGQNRVAGVPPDYFAATGQRWGNPLYRWDKLREENYSWWIWRIQKTLQLVHCVRIDHFRGFESYWAIPVSCPTAMDGVWEKGPGMDFFNALKDHCGDLPIIAEDLGIISSDVVTLRCNAGLPGMRVLQFAFDGNPGNPHLPYNISPDNLVYTGTHDNNTSTGWFKSLPELDKSRLCRFLGCKPAGFIDGFLRAAYSSPAKLCMIPLPDVLGLAGAHRFNTPGIPSGNWGWRFSWDMVPPAKIELIQTMAQLYGR